MSVPQLVGAVRSREPDVVHVVLPHPSIGLALPFLGDPGVVVTIHDPIPPTPASPLDYPWLLLNELVKRGYRWAADELIVHGERLRDSLVAAGSDPARVTAIPHGNYSFFTRWRREGVSEEADLVLFFGYIAEHKGLEYLLRAEDRLAQRVPGVRIAVAGKGELGRYERFITDPDRYEIRNEFVPNEDVAELFQRAAVVVLPYTSATQSGVIPIAYSFGTPVVATDVGSLPEVVDDGRTGFVVPPRRPDALADAVATLLSDDRRRAEMGERATEMAETDLAWGPIAARTVEVYERALSGGDEP
jgi:glycosyltransferase involved in cell wall biosynthesis